MKAQVVNETRQRGRLAETKWRDNAAGDGGTLPKDNGNEAAKGFVQFGQDSVALEQRPSSADVAGHSSAPSEASVHVHIDPLDRSRYRNHNRDRWEWKVRMHGERRTAALCRRNSLRSTVAEADLPCGLVDAVVQAMAA